MHVEAVIRWLTASLLLLGEANLVRTLEQAGALQPHLQGNSKAVGHSCSASLLLTRHDDAFAATCAR